MEFFKKIFKDDEKIVGLCAFSKSDSSQNDAEKARKYSATNAAERILSLYIEDSFVPKFTSKKLIYSTNYENNFFLL